MGKLFRKGPNKKGAFEPYAIWMIGQRKAFWRERIPEIPDTEIPINSKSSGRINVQPIRIASSTVQQVQMNIYQTNTYRKDFKD